MALMPGATHRLAGNDSNGRTAMARYDILCFHTIVGYAPAAAAHLSTHANGKIIQDRDTKYRSSANLDGNHRVISVETEDHGPAFAGYWKHASDVPPWTPAQCEANARIAAWAHKTHGIPLVLAPNSKPTSRGIGYHRQGCDGNFGSMAYGGRVAGGEKWSNAFGKVCPGDRRIKQLIEIVIPRARVLAGLDQEEDMPITDTDVRKIAAAVQGYRNPDVKPKGDAYWYQRQAYEQATKAVQIAAANQATLAAVAKSPDITPERLAAEVDAAVKRYTPTADAVATQLRPMLNEDIGPLVRQLFAEILKGDDAAEADALAEAFLSKFTEKLAARETQEA